MAQKFWLCPITSATAFGSTGGWASATRWTSKGSKGQVCVLCCCRMVGFGVSFQSCSGLSDWGWCSLPPPLTVAEACWWWSVWSWVFCPTSGASVWANGLRCFFCFSLLGLKVNPPGFLATSGLWTLGGCVSFLERVLDVIDDAGLVHVVTHVASPHSPDAPPPPPHPNYPPSSQRFPNEFCHPWTHLEECDGNHPTGHRCLHVKRRQQWILNNWYLSSLPISPPTLTLQAINGGSRNNPTIFSQMAVSGPSGTLVPRCREDFPIMGFLAVFVSCCREKYRLRIIGSQCEDLFQTASARLLTAVICQDMSGYETEALDMLHSLDGRITSSKASLCGCYLLYSQPPSKTSHELGQLQLQLPLSRLLWVLPAPRSKTRGRKAWWKCCKLEKSNLVMQRVSLWFLVRVFFFFFFLQESFGSTRGLFPLPSERN